MRLRLLLTALAAVATACVGAGDPVETPAAEGGPDVELAAVDRHAQQFDEDLADRRAGSQQEFATSSYITGHLQKAGYVVRLEPVPVANAVRSTLVIAEAPSGEAAAVVAVPYDTVQGLPPQGEDLGLFLEAARALRVRDPDHSVQFVALGAEHGGGTGHLGSARLAELLEDRDEEAPVITPAVVDGGGFESPGSPGDDLRALALDMEIEPARPMMDPVMPSLLRITRVLTEAGVEHAIAAGGIEEVGRVLLEYLSGL